MRRGIAFWALWVVLAPPAAHAASCGCGDEPGVVWAGDRPPSLRELADALAPVLWFSEDEPPILLGKTPLPHRHPCDPKPQGRDGIVYYQVNWLVKREHASLSSPVEEDPAFGAKVTRFGLRYYTYFDYDYGLNPHAHDLEMAEQRAVIDQTGSGCYRVRLVDTIAFAHGTDWYSNELLTTGDTKLPITLMVEEGKHALATDRNADGMYTPGYDVNTRINDAWGVRDVLASGYLLGGKYQSSMTKRRLPGTRALPPRADTSCVPRMLRSVRDERELLNRYELRPGYRVDIGACRNVDHYDHLAKWTRKNEFSSSYSASQHSSDLGEALSQPFTSTTSWYPKVSYRYDRGSGVALAFSGFDAREFYLVPKLNLVKNKISVEALVTQSATQFVSPYLSFGYARERRNDGDPMLSKFVTEAGAKFRLRVDWPWRIFGMGYEFIGLRLGARKTGFNDIGDIRFILELGAGLW